MNRVNKARKLAKVVTKKIAEKNMSSIVITMQVVPEGVMVGMSKHLAQELLNDKSSKVALYCVRQHLLGIVSKLDEISLKYD